MPPRSRSPSTTSSSTDDDIELSTLDEVVVTPNPNLLKGQKYDYDEDRHSDDDQHADEEALLSPGSGNSHRWRDTGQRKAPLGRLILGLVLETAPTLLFTTIGLMLTGELLDHVSHWQTMSKINELIMIIPVILNLKGNLEMNLSARLGTAANMGQLDNPKSRNSLILGNLALLQVQAAVVSFVAACVSFLLGLVVPDQAPETGEGTGTNSTTSAILGNASRTILARVPRPTHRPEAPKSGFAEFVMVSSTAMSAACISALVLGSFMCGLIVVCRKFGRDPDNIAPPIAACLGDLVTLTLLGISSTLLMPFFSSPPILLIILIALIVVVSIGVCGAITRRNPDVKDLIWQGWSPLFGAMVISSGTGIVLDVFVSRFEDFALLAVAISGLPGSVGSILISRLSTALHAASSTPHDPSASATFLPPQSHSNTQTPALSAQTVMLTLFLVTLPVEVILLSILKGLGWLTLGFGMISAAGLGFCLAVSISLFFARALTHLLWNRNLDPDMYAMPIHSAAMDLVGQLTLVACFVIVAAIGGKVAIEDVSGGGGGVGG